MKREIYPTGSGLKATRLLSSSNRINKNTTTINSSYPVGSGLNAIRRNAIKKK